MDIEKLRAIPLFAELSDHTLTRIGELSTEFDAQAGWVLVEVGQPGSGMFVLEEGTVEVQTPDGRHWEYGPGEFFGELALLTDHPRNARVQARSPVKVLAISRRDFSQLIKDEPEIAVAMLPKLAQRIDSPH
jgi:voltage-gated potassium channel